MNSDGNKKMIKMGLLGQFPEAARKLDNYVKDEQRKSRQRAQREKQRRQRAAQKRRDAASNKKPEAPVAQPPVP